MKPIHWLVIIGAALAFIWYRNRWTTIAPGVEASPEFAAWLKANP